MPDDIDPNLKLVLIEHTHPLEERVTRMETTIDHHSETIHNLGEKMDKLEDKIDEYHQGVINAFAEHAKDDREWQHQIQTAVSTNSRKISNMRAWLLGVLAACSGLFAIVKVIPSVISIIQTFTDVT